MNEQSAAALTASASILIDAPAATIFDILADPRQHSRIDGSGTVRSVTTGPARLTQGSKFGMQMKRGLGYRITNEVVEFDEGVLIAWKHLGAHRWRYELVPEDGSVRVTETWDGSRYGGVPRFFFRLIGLKNTQRAIEQTLVKLREAAESDAGAAE